MFLVHNNFDYRLAYLVIYIPHVNDWMALALQFYLHILIPKCISYIINYNHHPSSFIRGIIIKNIFSRKITLIMKQMCCYCYKLLVPIDMNEFQSPGHIFFYIMKIKTCKLMYYHWNDLVEIMNRLLTKQLHPITLNVRPIIFNWKYVTGTT